MDDINILHLNKGNSHFRNKVNDLQITIDKLKPDIISLSKANLYNTDVISINQFPDYNFFYDNFGTP